LPNLHQSYRSTERMASVTLKDIAKKTGLSVSTVSRLLNDKYDAKSRKAQKVVKIAQEMGYTPNFAAVSLRTNSTKTLGVIVPSINGGFFSNVLQGIENELKRFDFRVVICQTNDSSSEEKDAIERLSRFKVDGILISLSENSQNLELLSQLNKFGPKILQFDRIATDTDVPSIEMQDEKAAFLAMKQLIVKGLKSFLYIGISPDIRNNTSRFNGYKSAITSSNIKITTFYPSKINSKYEDELAEKIKGIDCILSYNDAIAVEALMALKQLNIPVPKQISVLGFDDRTFCKWVTPTLSSISRPIELLGQHAAQKMLQMINKDIEIDHVELSLPQVIFRDSVR